jgi:hypothetical protein
MRNTRVNDIYESVTLIIRDQLVCPPTWFLSFRDLTLYCNTFLHQDILIESDDRDMYWNWIKIRGGMDFIEEFVPIGRENGIRIDFEHNYPQTIVVDRISPENLHWIIAKIRTLVR